MPYITERTRVILCQRDTSMLCFRTSTVCALLDSSTFPIDKCKQLSDIDLHALEYDLTLKKCCSAGYRFSTALTKKLRNHFQS